MGPGKLTSSLANTRQQTEELPLPLTGQVDVDTDGLEEIRQNFPDGRPRIIRYVAQDEQGNYYNHGPWKVFNQAQPQDIVAFGTYRHGRMQGQWQRRHDAGSGGLFATKPFDLYQGPFLSVATFNDGKLDGIWSIYDAYQRNIFEISYKDGVRDGTATWWYPNRSKMREATFKNGLLNGEILAWDESEKLVRREEFIEGRRIVRNSTFYRANLKQTEDYFLDEQLIPEGEDNWWDATPTPYVPRGSKIQNGPSMKWYDNKQPKLQGQYKDGLQVGQFTWWHPNGNKQIEGFYVDGKKNRLWTWWYENGMKQVEGAYEDDEPIGRWRSWHADGQLRKEENFSVAPEAKSNMDPNHEELSNPENAIETPFELLPIPDDSDQAPATTLSGAGTDDLEGIEPLNGTTQEPAKDNPAEGSAQPKNGSNVGGEQNDGSLPAELFKRQ
jgi:antitoxin component YwqK of YwqJK toxin-antitoxin module